MGTPSFKDDVIIASEDGKLYKLSQADLAEYEVDYKNQKEFAPIVSLLKQGVSVAAVPVPDDQSGPHAGGDYLCYLLNLASLRKITSWED